MMDKVLLKGNEAIAEAAVRAGCGFFAGYPITPQSEILEYLSWRLPETGGTFIQSESELAGVSMVYGACAAGQRAMTSSSGPGYSLLHEGISYIASAELPCVFVNVARYGSGLGDIFQGQSDYWCTVKNGGNSDYRCIVLAPNSVQESADLTHLAFDLAEQHRNPVVLLTDASIGQMIEPVELKPAAPHDLDKNPEALNGTRGGKYKRIWSNMYTIPNYESYIYQKYRDIEKSLSMWEESDTEDADFVLVAYGISARIAAEAVRLGRERGLKIGIIRPVSLWPFPKAAFDKLSNVKAYVTIEMSALGQMCEDVALASGMRAPIFGVHTGGVVPDEEQILRKVEAIIAGTAEEVYRKSC